MRYLTLGGSVAAVLLAATACGGDGSATTAQPSDCDDGPELTVTDTGSTPRHAMELAPTVGDSVALDMRMEMGVDAQVDGESAPTQSVPAMTIGMTLEVDDVREDEIELSFVYDRAEVEGDDYTVQSMLESMVDSSGTLVTTRSGAFVDGDFQAAEGMDPAISSMTDQLDQQLAEMSIPLPTEPVGIGAEWEVATSLELNGVAFCNFYTYKLVEFDGDSYELETETEQEPIGGTIQTAGASIEVVGGEGHSSGRTRGSLSLPIAVSGTIEGTSGMDMEVDQGGDEVDQEVDTTIEVEISERR